MPGVSALEMRGRTPSCLEPPRVSEGAGARRDGEGIALASAFHRVLPVVEPWVKAVGSLDLLWLAWGSPRPGASSLPAASLWL
ncbi:MAG: hypothetical protein LKI58_00230 [Actinomyces sp.]|jgi:hypothetical protein|nr:hypothetical protein [Actinomyces sp.]MCI1641500.1 hypothetical protein [Actinomyces sp.]MCI1661756.1 hypothetical protein [Actinomyces sp.]MCI1690504.1 hypothetical protein [Actinomyces sp.]MCI1786485.1 hypothetical protein [Actinomyces sp.]MCI1829994.1 hypothetical protein [Actinomyces sp.]